MSIEHATILMSRAEAQMICRVLDPMYEDFTELVDRHVAFDLIRFLGNTFGNLEEIEVIN